MMSSKLSNGGRYVVGWLYALSGYVPNLHYRVLHWIEAMTF